MNKRLLFFLILLLSGIVQIKAQHAGYCASDAIEAALSQHMTDHQDKMLRLDQSLKRHILHDRSHPNRNADTTVYTIPVVWHILH
ncbi:MAG: hypothetical protein AAF206_20560, partial [Bacteroidota bacterium]